MRVLGSWLLNCFCKVKSWLTMAFTYDITKSFFLEEGNKKAPYLADSSIALSLLGS